ncbi:MAG: RagB/SusD family nutrient uptake outer membrane protein, partial [Tannerella sp.]|nr:RagB/SusD family nutrient uptake outer membrane protein [Tannerella sp.]
MKKNRSYTFIHVWLSAVMLMSALACNDGFMDRDPVTDLSNVSYWSSENDLKIYNNGTYNAAVGLRFFIGNESSASGSKYLSFMGMEAVSDNFASTDANMQVWANISAGLHVVPAGATTTTGLSWSWSFLYRLNFFLDNYEKVTGIPTATRDMYAGETFFWRAWFYFDKIQEYGDVPLILKSLTETSPELYAKQNPRSEVADAVLADIDKAVEYLPEEWPAASPDRVNKYTALTLKARYCLYEGTWRKYHGLTDYQRFLEAAAAAADEVIKSEKYQLYNTGKPGEDYRTLFTTLDLHGNPEVILAKYYATGKYAHSVTANLVSEFMVGVTKDLVDDYLCKEPDGTAKPIGLSAVYNDDVIENVFDNRDPRLSQTVLDPRQEKDIFGTEPVNTKGYPRLNYMSGSSYVSLTGYNYIKNFDPLKPYGSNSEEIDFPILRYAEVLLVYAEAKAELGTITQSDLDRSINLLRNRAGMPGLDLNPVMDPKYAGEGISSLLVEIRRERRVELSFENSRYHDLMRWKKGVYLTKPVLGMRL